VPQAVDKLHPLVNTLGRQPARPFRRRGAVRLIRSLIELAEARDLLILR
jgi:hypothetical protein